MKFVYEVGTFGCAVWGGRIGGYTQDGRGPSIILYCIGCDPVVVKVNRYWSALFAQTTALFAHLTALFTHLAILREGKVGDQKCTIFSII